MGIAEDYDYVWAYNTAKYAPQLQRISDQVFKDGDLAVYRIRKTAEQEESGDSDSGGSP
ncbi:MAG TPA: hypothetical protein VE961_20205 [Pyrinomonadaceae bacterium]|nr:hypothetical protein [Pyrinomonadaceae bacterium]